MKKNRVRIALVVVAVLLLLAWCGGGSKDSGSGSEKSAAFSKAPDATALVVTEAWGIVPASQVVVVLAENSDRGDAEDVAEDLGGEIVGELPDIALYQIETDGTTANDLDTSLTLAAAAKNVELVFPNIPLALSTLAGDRCAPLADQAYQGTLGQPYEMIGVQAGWDVLRAAGVDFADVHVGVVDSEITTARGELSGPVRVTGLEAGDLSDQPPVGAADGQVSHGTAVAHIIAADVDNGGIAGVAGILGGSLSVTTTDIMSKAGSLTPAVEADPNDAAVYIEDGIVYTVDALVAIQRQVDAGATIINASFGQHSTSPGMKSYFDTYRRFLVVLAERHPEVLIVAAAGNEGDALDGTNDSWGHPLPNLVTVGAVDANGAPASFTNFAVVGGEVSLSAPGVNVAVTTTSTGIALTASGTSFSAPLVSAAAALLRAADPTLTAADIKRVLVETAVGGILRVDAAVLRVVNAIRERDGLVPLDAAAINALVAVDVSAARTSALTYSITATLRAVDQPGTDLAIAATGDGAVDGASLQGLTVPGAVTFGYGFTAAPGTATITVTRLDNQACSSLKLDTLNFDGLYEGSFQQTFQQFQLTWTLVFEVVDGIIGGNSTSTNDYGGGGVTCRSTATISSSGGIDSNGSMVGTLFATTTSECTSDFGVPIPSQTNDASIPYTGRYEDGKLVGTITTSDGATYPFTLTKT